MTILWFLNIEHQYGLQHGATLRYTNFGKLLVASGHQVYYVLTNHPRTDREGRNRYLDTLKQQQCFTDYLEIDLPPYSPLVHKLSRLLFYPRAGNRLLASIQNPYKQKVFHLVKHLGADLCILSERANLFLLPDLSSYAATIIDWCDSLVLYYVREMRLLLSKGQFKQMLLEARHLSNAFSEESSYSRYPDANIVVSHGDKRSLDRLNGKPHINRVIHNGVTLPPAAMNAVPRRSERLIFTGTMNFPPNYKGAIWFIDHVMPRLLRSDPGIQLVIAGQDPVPQLKARANEHIIVTGAVPDMKAEIAQSSLYVAPIFSGTGFRNKVVEAIACGVSVIGTPMALEFLDESIRSRLSVAATAEDFSNRILEYRRAPSAFDERLQQALTLLREDYTWARRTEQLAALCHEVIERRAARPHH